MTTTAAIFFYTVIIIITIKIILWNKKEKTQSREISKKPNYKFYSEAHKLTEFLMMKNDYMISSAWKEKRKKKFLETDFQCELCGETSNLHIHHLRGYDKIPYEPLEDLVVLCEKHHREEHQKHGYPTTYEDYMIWNHPLEK